LDIEPEMTVEALVEGMSHCGFGARRLAGAVKIYEQMLAGEYTNFFTLSGAMVPAGMRNIVSGLIRSGHIDVLVTSGANLVHDIIESFGAHCLGTPDSDDAALRAEGLSRIYDLYLRDEDFIKFEELMQSILPNRIERISGAELMKAIGSQISDKRSILRSACDRDIPVFCPALPRLHDRPPGMAAQPDQEAQCRCLCGYKADRGHLLPIAPGRNSNSRRGVPKNFALQSMMITPNSFQLAVQLTTDTPEAGGLSGATLSEAVSWGKISAQAQSMTVYGDATITFPLLVAATLSRLKRQGLEKA